jgi:hypothetical protein
LRSPNRGYEDLLEGEISDDFWARKSKAWEAELAVVDGERARFETPRPDTMVTAENIPELAKRAETSTNRRIRPNREIAGNGAIELQSR